MYNVWIYLGVFFLELGFICYFTYRQDPIALRSLYASNIILSCTFGFVLSMEEGIQLSAGAMYIASSFVIFYIMFRLIDHLNLVKMVGYVCVALITTYVITQPITFVHGPFINAVMAENIIDILNHQTAIGVAVFLAFVVGMYLTILVFRALQPYGMAIAFTGGHIFGEIFMTSVYYLGSFQRIGAPEMIVQFIIYSVGFKIFLGIFAVPVLYWLQYHGKLEPIDVEKVKFGGK